MKPNDTVINVTEDGNIEFIEGTVSLDMALALSGDLDLSKKTVRRRLSRIVPASPWKRVAFYTLRFLCGERGRAAAFTRTWKGPWRMRILSTGQTEVFELRQAAVDRELEILTDPKFDL